MASVPLLRAASEQTVCNALEGACWRSRYVEPEGRYRTFGGWTWQLTVDGPAHLPGGLLDVERALGPVRDLQRGLWRRPLQDRAAGLLDGLQGALQIRRGACGAAAAVGALKAPAAIILSLSHRGHCMERAAGDITGKADEPPTDTMGPTSPEELPAGAVLIAHTDGACSGNPGPGGWSVVFSFDGFNLGEFSGHHNDTTNNRMELTAVRKAIHRAPLPVALLVVTDSLNVIGWLSRGWKRNNAGIAAVCREIDALRAERTAAGGGAVTFKHVKGHNGDPLNERGRTCWPQERSGGGEARDLGGYGAYQCETISYSAMHCGSIFELISSTPGTSSLGSMPRAAKSSSMTNTGIFRFSIRSTTSLSMRGAWSASTRRW